MASAQTACPATTPKAVAIPPERPPRRVFRTVNAVSGPGRHDDSGRRRPEADQLGRHALSLLFRDVEVGKAAVALVEVEAVAEEELVGMVKPT